MEKKLKMMACFAVVGTLAFPISANAGGVVRNASGISYGADLKNNQNFKFDGHKAEEVALRPRTNPNDVINVGKDADLDDQVIYLYHPKSGKFLYAEGLWGTQAVLRWESFGTPMNLVDVTDDELLKQMFYPKSWTREDGHSPVHYGFYSESIAQGHYLGRENNNYFGKFGNGGESFLQNFPTLWSDRGGSNPFAKADWLGWSRNPDGTYSKNWHRDAEDKPIYDEVDWDDILKCQLPQADLMGIFNWDLEEVDLGDENLHVYKLVYYTRNGSVFKDEELEQPIYKHYYKVKTLDFFQDGNPFTAPYCKGSNWDLNADGSPYDGSYLVDWAEDEADPVGSEPSTDLTSDDADYYWQIVTRRDLKDKFIRDFKDPYTVEPQTGNFNFVIDNADFSRPFRRTFSTDHATETVYWQDPQSTYEMTSKRDNFLDAPYDRYWFWRPKNDGVLSQEFQPLQQGLFRIDVLGFSTGDAKASLRLSDDSRQLLIYSDYEGDKDLADGDEVKLDQFNSIDDALEGVNYQSDIDDYARLESVYGNTFFAPHGSGDVANVNDWKVVRFALNSTAEIGEKVDVTAGDGVVSAVADAPGIYAVYYNDEYGRKSTGVYVVGPQADVDLTGLNYYQSPDGKGWPVAQTIVVRDGETLEFGKHVRVNNQNDDNANHYLWILPDGTIKRNVRAYKFDVNYLSGGDYVCVYHNDEGKVAVFHYTVYVENGPAPYHVSLSASQGNADNAEAAVVLGDYTSDITLNFKKADARPWVKETAPGLDNVYLVKKGDNVDGVYVNGTDGGWTLDYYWNNTEGTGWETSQDITISNGKPLEFGPHVHGNNVPDERCYWFGPNGFFRAQKRDVKIDNVSYADAGKYFMVYFEDGKYALLTYNVIVNGYERSSKVTLDGTNQAGLIGNKSFNDLTINGTTSNEFDAQQLAEKIQDSFEYTRESNLRNYANRVIGKYLYSNENKFVKSLYVYVPEDKVPYGAKEAKVTIQLNVNGIGGEDLANFVAIDNVRVTYMGEMPLVLDQTKTEEQLGYLELCEHEWIPVYLDREFVTDAWNAFVSPLPLSKAQFLQAFGPEAKLSEISPEGLLPDDPYIIKFNTVDVKAKEDGDVVIEPKHYYIVKPSALNYVTEVPSLGTENGEAGYQFYRAQSLEKGGGLLWLGKHNVSSHTYEDNGTKSEKLNVDGAPYYKGVDGYKPFNDVRYEYNAAWTQKNGEEALPHENYIQINGSFAQQYISEDDVNPIQNQNDEGNTDGAYIFAPNANEDPKDRSHVFKLKDPLTLNGFRFYIVDKRRNADRAKALVFDIDGVIDGGETTEIVNALTEDKVENQGAVYTVAGQRVKAEGLQKGLYVKNGKKFLVK